MPILLLIGSICLYSRYLSDKYTTLKFYSRPNYADAELIIMTLKIMFDFMWVKILLSTMMLSTPSLFPTKFEE